MEKQEGRTVMRIWIFYLELWRYRRACPRLGQTIHGIALPAQTIGKWVQK